MLIVQASICKVWTKAWAWASADMGIKMETRQGRRSGGAEYPESIMERCACVVLGGSAVQIPVRLHRSLAVSQPSLVLDCAIFATDASQLATVPQLFPSLAIGGSF